MGRIRSKAFIITRADLENHLIKTLKVPKDIVVTGITKVANQEGWIVTTQSREYPEIGDLDLLSTSRLKENNVFPSATMKV